MTEKQKRFCEEYVVDCNATQAAIRAGYSEKTAYSMGQRLLKKVECQSYISELLEEMKNNKIASAQEVMEHLTAVMRNRLKEQVVVVEGIGDGMSCARTIEKDVSMKERVKAAELLAKRYGLLTDKVSIDGGAVIQIIDDIKEVTEK